MLLLAAAETTYGSPATTPPMPKRKAAASADARRTAAKKAGGGSSGVIGRARRRAGRISAGRITAGNSTSCAASARPRSRRTRPPPRHRPGPSEAEPQEADAEAAAPAAKDGEAAAKADERAGRGDAEPEPPPRAANGHANGAAPAEGGGLDDSLEAYMDNLQSYSRPAAKAASNSRCVLLENLLSAEAAADPAEVRATRMETGHECAKWGRAAPRPRRRRRRRRRAAEHIGGRIFVEFETEHAAAECARAMDGRFFDGRRVNAYYYDVGDFLAERLDEAGTALTSQAITWDDIVAMNSRPASSWDTMEIDTHGTMGGPTDAELASGLASPAIERPHPGGPKPERTTSQHSEFSEDEDGGGGDDPNAEDDEPDGFHDEFMRAMRAQVCTPHRTRRRARAPQTARRTSHPASLHPPRPQAEEAARRQAKASQQLLEGDDAAMDALVDQFPDMAEARAAEGDDDDDSEDEERRLEAERAKKKRAPEGERAAIHLRPPSTIHHPPSTLSTFVTSSCPTSSTSSTSTSTSLHLHHHPLQVDHTATEYAPFRRNLYVEVPELKAMSDADVEALKKSLDGIKTRGGSACPARSSGGRRRGSDRLLAVIEKQGYAAPRHHLHHHLHHLLHHHHHHLHHLPTHRLLLPCRYAAPFPIQAQALPCIMSGRDVIAVARTGSGKTMG